MDEQLHKRLALREQENALRTLPPSSTFLEFSSNDYLGLASRVKTSQQLSNGSGGSRLISGNHKLFVEVENELAQFYNTDATLIYNSGYDTNIGLFSCLLQKGDTYIYDQYIHASVRDGIRLSNANSFAFEHNNLTSLEQKLQNAVGKKVVIVESIYSMDGDIAPLTEIAELCQKHQAELVVDEAHATGVFGTHGQGLVSQLKLENKVYARIHTFGKALGVHGACIAGSETLKQYLVNFSRSFIYTTALPEHSVAAIQQAHLLCANAHHERKTIKENIMQFRNELSPTVKNHLIASCSPIQCIICPGNVRVKELAATLQEMQFDVKAILHPTVAKGEERIRICLHASNTSEEINALVKAINTHFPNV